MPSLNHYYKASLLSPRGTQFWGHWLPLLGEAIKLLFSVSPKTLSWDLIQCCSTKAGFNFTGDVTIQTKHKGLHWDSGRHTRPYALLAREAPLDTSESPVPCVLPHGVLSLPGHPKTTSCRFLSGLTASCDTKFPNHRLPTQSNLMLVMGSWETLGPLLHSFPLFVSNKAHPMGQALSGWASVIEQIDIV